MNDKIRDLLIQITALEDEMEELLHKQQEQVLVYLKDGRYRIREELDEAHRKLKQGIWRWMLDSRPRNLASAPFIYGMIVPFVFMDLSLTCYQWICFPLYRIGRVRRAAYIILDRHKLHYLNAMEKFNCVYCGYANGLLAYAREIAARTELYWCPVKHAGRIRGRHSRYHEFLDYGDGVDFHARLAALRQDLSGVTRKGKHP